MARGIVDTVVLGWRHPRAAMAGEIAGGLSDARALVQLTLACGLFFVASLPNAIRAAQRLDIDDPVAGAFAAHLFGYLAIAPLLAYGLAALVHLAARAGGARGPFLSARAALFFSLLLAAPLALGLALLGVGLELAAPALLPLTAWLGYAVLGFWLWLFAASLAEAEGFRRTGRVAAVLVIAFGGLAAVLGTLARAGG